MLMQRFQLIVKLIRSLFCLRLVGRRAGHDERSENKLCCCVEAKVIKLLRLVTCPLGRVYWRYGSRCLGRRVNNAAARDGQLAKGLHHPVFGDSTIGLT